MKPTMSMLIILAVILLSAASYYVGRKQGAQDERRQRLSEYAELGALHADTLYQLSHNHDPAGAIVSLQVLSEQLTRNTNHPVDIGAIVYTLQRMVSDNSKRSR